MLNLEAIRKATPYQDINDILCFLSEGISEIFGADLLGFYLTGSLSYGDFNPSRSDIDLAAVIKEPARREQIESLAKLHEASKQISATWGKRLECSYIPLDMLKEILPPQEPRPYYGDGTFYAEARYGNEWIINQYFLYEHGIALLGPGLRTYIAPVDIWHVQEACIRDLHKEWEPKINAPEALTDSHLASYIVLNLCRILYTVKESAAVSKNKAAAWAIDRYPDWADLIKAANGWHYGKEMGRKEEIMKFIEFALSEVQGYDFINKK